MHSAQNYDGTFCELYSPCPMLLHFPSPQLRIKSQLAARIPKDLRIDMSQAETSTETKSESKLKTRLQDTAYRKFAQAGDL